MTSCLRKNKHIKTSAKCIFLALCIVVNAICCDKQYIQVDCNHITMTESCFASYRRLKKKKKGGLDRTSWDLVYKL